MRENDQGRASSLRSKPVRCFGPQDVSWMAGEAAEQNTPIAILNTFGDSIGVAALNIALQAVKEELIVSPYVRNALPEGWRLGNFEYRTKSPESISRKIHDTALVRRWTVQQAKQAVDDALRYTMIAPDKSGFCTGLIEAVDYLKQYDYHVAKMLNTFH